MGFPEPTQAVKGKPAVEIHDDLNRKRPRPASGRWKGSRDTYLALKENRSPE
jgi:hypothetical protein